MREELSFVAENGAFVKDRQAERRGILPEQCAAFGDGGNDIEIEKLIRDAKDQPILNAAIVFDVDIVLTGDKDFLSLEIEHPR